MHQPYYKDLLTNESDLPWVRLHGVKDYLDMVQILKKYPKIKNTFNVVPSLLEQVEDYCNNNIKDKFLELSYKPAKDLTLSDKQFILNNFFSINREKVVSLFPRYYELYLKKQANSDFKEQDLLDLQVLFNLAWIDPSFRLGIQELKNVQYKGRFFNEQDKRIVLEAQKEILKDIIPTYKDYLNSGKIELTVTPYYHPILPLLYNSNTAKESNNKTILPKKVFSYPEDVKAQVFDAVKFFKDRFGLAPIGMWPSEQSVSERILPDIMNSGIKWIVTDEAILFNSLKKKKRDTELLYQPHSLKREEGELNIVFRDRNLSDMIGFVYHSWKAEPAVDDFMKHLSNISKAFKGKDILVTIAMDGENAWEYYTNDGHDFLNLLYQRISDADDIISTTVSEYLKDHPVKSKIKHLSPGSWIYANFNKWMNHPYKAKAWDWLIDARKALELSEFKTKNEKSALAWKQMYILEGSDWFWWYGEDPDGSFDRLYRLHLRNFYTLIKKDIPDYLDSPLTT